MKEEDYNKLVGKMVDPVRSRIHPKIFAKMLQKIDYNGLSKADQQSFNRIKAMGVLVEFGFTSQLAISHPGKADLIITHKNGEEFDVRSRTRPGFWKQHLGHEVFICCRGNDDKTWYLYPHDEVYREARKSSNFAETAAWKDGGSYHFPPPISSWVIEMLKPYKLAL